jgi:hypothetical protein
VAGTVHEVRTQGYVLLLVYIVYRFCCWYVYMFIYLRAVDVHPTDARIVYAT